MSLCFRGWFQKLLLYEAFAKRTHIQVEQSFLILVSVYFALWVEHMNEVVK